MVGIEVEELINLVRSNKRYVQKRARKTGIVGEERTLKISLKDSLLSVGKTGNDAANIIFASKFIANEM